MLSRTAAIRVAGAIALPRPAGADETRFSFSHKYAKLLFFLCREGVQQTLAKVKASRLQRSVQAMRQVVIAWGEGGDGHRYLAVGPQDSPEASYMAFPSSFIVRLHVDHEVEQFAKQVTEHLRSRPEQLLELFNYSPFSGLIPTFTLRDILPEFESCADAPLCTGHDSVAPPPPEAPVR